MTDKELLKAAARAAGRTNWQSEACCGMDRCDWEGVPYWNPLKDDRDAARLEAVLQLHVEWHPLQNKVTVGTAEVHRTEFYGQDRQAARRRAGVRAAAAMDSRHNAVVNGG